MYAFSFSSRSRAPATTGTPGWSACIRASPSGAATTHTNTMSSAPAYFTYRTAAVPEPPVASLGSTTSARRPVIGGSFA